MSTTDSQCCELASRAPTEQERDFWYVADSFEGTPPLLVCDTCVATIAINAAIKQLRFARHKINNPQPTWAKQTAIAVATSYVEDAVSMLCYVPEFGLSYGPRKDEVSA